MDYKELQRLIKLAKKSGLKHVKVGDVELNFTEEALRPRRYNKKDDGQELKNRIEDQSAAVFWSVQDIDPLSKAQ